MECNANRQEIGGKDLLLKVCSDEQTSAVSSGDATITDVGHGLEVGDIVRFIDNGSITNLVEGDFYFVSVVESADAFQVAATRGGVSISPNATNAALTYKSYKTLGGLRTKSGSFASDAIEVTNHGSNQWRQVLDDAGIRSMEFSGSGVYTNETLFQLVMDRTFLNQLMCMMIIDVKADQIFEGCFKVTQIEMAGEFDGESSYSISAVSAGEIQKVIPS